jgi:hypothetical protein
MLTIDKQPNSPHSSTNDNWYLFKSDIDYFPNFVLRCDFIASNSEVYNRFLVPPAPAGELPVNIKNVMRDFVPFWANPFIQEPIKATASATYSINVSERFEGFYIRGTSSSGILNSVDVINNNQWKSIELPTVISEIDFKGGFVTSTPEMWVTGFSTASNGFIQSFTVSRSSLSNIGLSASTLPGDLGYLVLDEYSQFSTGATISTSQKLAIKSNINREDYNIDNNYDGRIMGTPSAKFLTNSPRIIEIGDDWHTLSFLGTASNWRVLIEQGSNTFEIPFNLSFRIDIPAGPKNLQLLGIGSGDYKIRLVDGSGAKMSEDFTFKRKCGTRRPIRLCWLNEWGGIDYYNFNYTSQKVQNVERENYTKNNTWNRNYADRDLATWKSESFNVYSVSSDPVSPEEASWLGECLKSKEVWWIKGDKLIPIVVETTSSNQSIGWEWEAIRIEFRESWTWKD